MSEVAQRVEMLASVGCRSVQVVVLRIYRWLPTKHVNATETPTITGGVFGSEGTDGAGGLMRSIRSESSCSSAYTDLVNEMLVQKKVANQTKVAFSLSY